MSSGQANIQETLFPINRLDIYLNDGDNSLVPLNGKTEKAFQAIFERLSHYLPGQTVITKSGEIYFPPSHAVSDILKDLQDLEVITKPTIG